MRVLHHLANRGRDSLNLHSYHDGDRTVKRIYSIRSVMPFSDMLREAFKTFVVQCERSGHLRQAKPSSSVDPTNRFPQITTSIQQ